MNIRMETGLSVVAAVFVIFTAMIDPRASFSVAVVAILCILTYMVLSPKQMKMEEKLVNKTQKRKTSSRKTSKKKSR